MSNLEATLKGVNEDRGTEMKSSATSTVSVGGRESHSAVTPRHLKYISLVVLALQNAALIIVMRYVRTRPGDMFASTTAVVMTEVLKVTACFIIIWFEEGMSVRGCCTHLNENIIQQPWDCVRVSVPAFIYMIQNNLIYVAASNLDVATFQVTYQLKILTTAVLSVIMLRKQLTGLQWVSLILLFCGVAAVNVQANAKPVVKAAVQGAAELVTTRPKSAVIQRPFVGFVAVVTACCLSGFAGVYFEKILKSTPQSIYVRNVQLGVVGMVLGLGAVYVTDGAKVAAHGFFFGYDIAVWSVIMLHAFGGIVIAVVVKYADNILKGFASSAAIIISCVVSMYIFDFELSTLFIVGATFVIIATYMYSKFVPKPPVSPFRPESADLLPNSGHHKTPIQEPYNASIKVF